MKRLSILLAVAGAASLAVGSAGALLAPAQAAAPARTPRVERFVPTHRGEVLPLHGTTVDSLNWSGYADLPPSGQKVTAVATTFSVPTAGLDPPGFAATWAGIGGYNTSDLIQAGVEEDSAPSNPLLGSQYYAWYELLPASETPLTNCTGDPSCTVSPGDTVSLLITQAGSSTWDISVVDSGHWSWSQSVTYSSSGSSAEWIQEAPTLVAAQTLMANVGTVHFGPGDTYSLDGGSAQTVASGNPVKIVLSPTFGLVDEAYPSALAADGESFNVCSYAESCPAP